MPWNSPNWGTSACTGQALVDAVGKTAPLQTYNGLGHALSPTETLAEYRFDVMALEHINDLIARIDAQS